MKLAPVKQLLSALRDFLTRTSGPVGLTTAQIFIAIYERNLAGNPAYLGQLCRDLGFHDASVAGVTTKLKDLGLIKAKKGEDRTIVFEVTAKGRAFLDALFDGTDKVSEALMKPVDAKLAKKQAPAKKAALAKKETPKAPVKKAAPAKKAVPVKKESSKAAPAKKAAPVKQEASKETPAPDSSTGNGTKMSFD